MSSAMLGMDIYMRTTDEKGRVTYSEHRVYDAGLYVSTQEMLAIALNKEKNSTLATAVQITHEQYVKRSL